MLEQLVICVEKKLEIFLHFTQFSKINFRWIKT